VQLGNDGDLQTLQLSNVVATQPVSSELSLVTRRSIHGDFPPEFIGTECRITGSALRADGRLRADHATLLMPASQIPMITIQNHAAASSPAGALKK
jgi:hypothetical protein